MDFHSLAAAHMSARREPASRSAAAEARYWRDQARRKRPRIRIRLLLPLATTLGVVLLLLGIAQA